MTERRSIWRIGLVLLAAVGVWCALGARLVQLHLGPNSELRQRVTRIRKVEQDILVGRGRILDCNGNILALDIPLKNVCADPQTILEKGHLKFVGAQLARILDLEPAMVFSRLSRPDRRFEYVKRYVPEDVTDHLRRMQLSGVFFEDVSARHYPKGAMFAHVIGFSNLKGEGSAGVEQRMDSLLRGRPGLRISEKDGRRREVYTKRSLDIAPQEGADVFLTLDQNLQHIVEKALAEAVEQHQAKGAWAIIERVKTGEILAMASVPSYDPNEYRSTAQELMLNRSISYVYEPGSTFKAVVIAGALNEGTVNPENIFDCENGRWIYRGRPLNDYHPYGRLSVADILKKSSNIGAAKVAITMGDRKLESYLRAFGIGRAAGVELPGEEAGILHPANRWSALSISRIAMGHEVCVTSLQMLNAMCAIANDGFLMKPTIVKRVVDARGNTIREFAPEVLGRPIREDTARLMQRLLARTTEEGGTGTRARVDGYTVAGKTGTAQKVLPGGGYSQTANIASFVGFLPAEQPELAVIVVVDEPQPLRTGGAVSAPVFQQIASQAVRYLDVRPGPPDSLAAVEQGRSANSL